MLQFTCIQLRYGYGLLQLIHYPMRAMLVAQRHEPNCIASLVNSSLLIVCYSMAFE
jgi:hypothetical protein